MVTTITPTNVTSSASYLTYIYKKKADVSLIFWPSIDRVLEKLSPLLKILLILCPVGTGDVLQNDRFRNFYGAYFADFYQYCLFH